MKFYHQLLKKHDVQAMFPITSGKQMTNNYAPCLNKINCYSFLYKTSLRWIISQFLVFFVWNIHIT